MTKDPEGRSAFRRDRVRGLLIAAAVIAFGLCEAPRMQAPRMEAARDTLDIYLVDVEGGQATLVATPAGETLLVDTGFPGSGSGFDATPGDPARARDAQRILAAARDAGVTRIDYLLITHF